LNNRISGFITKITKLPKIYDKNFFFYQITKNIRQTTYKKIFLPNYQKYTTKIFFLPNYQKYTTNNLLKFFSSSKLPKIYDKQFNHSCGRKIQMIRSCRRSYSNFPNPPLFFLYKQPLFVWYLISTSTQYQFNINSISTQYQYQYQYQ